MDRHNREEGHEITWGKRKGWLHHFMVLGRTNLNAVVDAPLRRVEPPNADESYKANLDRRGNEEKHLIT
jgi:hypothetical protein